MALRRGTMTSADGNEATTSQTGSLEIDKETTSASGSKSTARGRGGKGGARQDTLPTVQLSKALSYILRHGAAKEHLKMAADGYISLDAVLARPKLSKIKMEHGGSPTQEDVMQVVETNDKKRFEVSQRESGQVFIRAVQGHSISEVTSLDHVPLTLSDLSILSSNGTSSEEQDGGTARLPDGVEILHGTSRDAWDKIRASGGLSRMKRNHIHLAKGRPGSDSVISGMRSSSAIIIHVDIIAALHDGIAFFVASNGAVLTSGKGDSGILPLDYISKVEDSKTGTILWHPSRDQDQHRSSCTLAQ